MQIPVRIIPRSENRSTTDERLSPHELPQEDPPSTANSIDELLQATCPAIARSLLRRMGWQLDSSAREDCLQEALIHLWSIREHLERLPHSQRGPYAFACLRRKLLKEIRRESVYRHHFIHLEDIAGALSNAPSDPVAPTDPITLSALTEQFEDPALARAVQQLSGPECELLHRFYVLDESDQQIAARMGISCDAVKMRRARIVWRLRRLLERIDGHL